MQHKSGNKMISNDDIKDSTLGTTLAEYHFSGAGSNLPPVIIKASSQEEAEHIWRKKNEEAGKSQHPSTTQS